MTPFQDIIDLLSPTHQGTLLWFQERQGQEVPWPKPLPDGTFIVNKAKGIHKPAGLQYAVSVRQSLSSPYADHDPIVNPDGSWTYQYFQEQLDPSKRDSQFANVALMACARDGIPVGVLRQTKAKPDPRYHVMGLALVKDWRDGHFQLEGFGPTGASGTEGSGATGSAGGLLKTDDFNPANVEDARRWIEASIVRRQGQGQFRTAVLVAYENRCALSDCDVLDVLEAAHIYRYLGSKTNVISNGLLLRGDLHTLYDRGLIAIDPTTMRLMVAPQLRGSEYAALEGKLVRLPQKPHQKPNAEALKHHADWARGTWTS